MLSILSLRRPQLVNSRRYDKEIGFSYVITTGNEADLDVSDFLEYLLEDPGTDVICLAIDGLKKPKKFLKRLDYAREKKPVIILKMGGSRLGSKAALSHTGAITDSEMVFNAAMRQHGALVVDDFEDLLELASLLHSLTSIVSDSYQHMTSRRLPRESYQLSTNLSLWLMK